MCEDITYLASVKLQVQILANIAVHINCYFLYFLFTFVFLFTRVLVYFIFFLFYSFYSL